MTSLTPSGRSFNQEGICAFFAPYVCISDDHQYPVFGALVDVEDLRMARWSDHDQPVPVADIPPNEPRKSTFSLCFALLDDSQMISRFE
jgi:hypothetical protein